MGEEEEHLESSGDGKSDSSGCEKMASRAGSSTSLRANRRTRKMPSYTEEDPEEEEHASSREDNTSASDGEERDYRPRQASRSARQLKATEAVSTGQRTNRRKRKKPSYVEKD